MASKQVSALKSKRTNKRKWEQLSSALVEAKTGCADKRRRCIERQGRGFTLQGKYVRGVRDTNQRLFYPEYTYEKARNGALRPRPASSAANGATRTKRTGISRGKTVDHQLSKAVDLMHKYGVEPLHLLDLKQHQAEWRRAAAPMHVNERGWLTRFAREMHPFARQFLELMVQQDWLPHAGQRLCASSMARLGTAVDVVVVHRSRPRQHILVEIKAGYYSYLNRYYKKMKHPYGNLTDCPLNQFYLQLAVTRMLYERTYANQKNVQAFVVVLHEHGTDVRPLPSKVTQHDAQAWKHLCLTRHETQKVRKQQLNRHRTGAVKQPVKPAFASSRTRKKPSPRKIRKKLG